MNFKEALIAHLQGEKVEVREGGGYSWQDFGDYYSHTHLQTLTTKGYADSFQFRLKPRTITVNGREIVAGESETPKLQSEYFLPHVSKENRYASEIWDASEFDLRVLNDGLVHLTKENAIAHAKAMLGID